MLRINELDFLVTKGSLAGESPLYPIPKREQWSSDLDNTIREVSLWKLIESDKLDKISKEKKVKQIMNKMK